MDDQQTEEVERTEKPQLAFMPPENPGRTVDPRDPAYGYKYPPDHPPARAQEPESEVVDNDPDQDQS